jgi:hypothetical protein
MLNKKFLLKSQISQVEPYTGKKLEVRNSESLFLKNAFVTLPLAFPEFPLVAIIHFFKPDVPTTELSALLCVC